MPTPKQNTRISAAEWRERYAQIAPLYVGGHVQIAKPINWERVRQWEEFGYALSQAHPKSNVRLPREPGEALTALRAVVEGGL